MYKCSKIRISPILLEMSNQNTNPHGFSCLPQKNDYNMMYKNVNVFIKKFWSTKYNLPN